MNAPATATVTVEGALSGTPDAVALGIVRDVADKSAAKLTAQQMACLGAGFISGGVGVLAAALGPALAAQALDAAAQSLRQALTPDGGPTH